MPRTLKVLSSATQGKANLLSPKLGKYNTLNKTNHN